MSEENNIPGDGAPVKDEPIVDQAKGSDEKNGEIKTLESKISALEERLQQQSALLGKFVNAAKKEAQPEPAKKPKTDVEQYSELKAQIEELQAKNQKQERATKLSAIELALVEAGADPARAKMQVDFFAFQLGDKLQIDDSAVVVKEGDSVETIKAWAKAKLESDEGSFLRAYKVGPSVKNAGGPSGSVSKTVLTSAEYSAGYARAAAEGKDAAKAFAESHTMQKQKE